jgi:hypothetical protein
MSLGPAAGVFETMLTARRPSERWVCGSRRHSGKGEAEVEASISVRTMSILPSSSVSVSGQDASVGGEGDHDVRTMRSMPPDDSGGCIGTKLVPNRTSNGGSATSPAGDDYYPVGVLGRSGRGVGRSVDLDVVIIFKTS